MAKKITLKEVGAMLEHVVKHMFTKEDGERLEGRVARLEGQVGDIRTQVNSIEQQLRETRIEVRLGDLEEKVFGQARR